MMESHPEHITKCGWFIALYEAVAAGKWLVPMTTQRHNESGRNRLHWPQLWMITMNIGGEGGHVVSFCTLLYLTRHNAMNETTSPPPLLAN
jgi:hypothetical protein